MIKLIASDMDGTLLNSFGKLNPEFNTVIKELASRGIYFACISGRNYERLSKIFKDVDEDLIYISDNGNYAEFKGEVLIKNILDKKVVKEISKEISQIKGCKISYSTNKSMYTEDKIVYNVSKLIKFKNNLVDDISSIEEDVIKCSIICLPSKQDALFNRLKNKFPDLYIAKSGKHTIDINSSNFNKGIALDKIKEKLNIKYEETMVFGDYLNDYEMMDSAYYSYAMKNAHPKLKEKARFMAPKNTENGVLEVIKKEVLFNKEKAL